MQGFWTAPLVVAPNKGPGAPGRQGSGVAPPWSWLCPLGPWAPSGCCDPEDKDGPAVQAPLMASAPWFCLLFWDQVKKHLWEYLKKQAAPLLESSVDPLPEDHPVKSPLRMGLIVLFAVEKFNIPLSDSDLSMLCTLLCSNIRSPGDLHSDLSDIFETYQRYVLCVCQMIL